MFFYWEGGQGGEEGVRRWGQGRGRRTEVQGRGGGEEGGEGQGKGQKEEARWPMGQASERLMSRDGRGSGEREKGGAQDEEGH